MIIQFFLRRHRGPLFGIGCLFAVACVISSTTRGRMLDKSAAAGTWVETPMKAYLVDGSVIVFGAGARVDNTHVIGDGRRFGAVRSDSVVVSGVSLDSVVGFEVYERTVNPIRTVVYSTLATTATVIASAATWVVLFGSCPTIYGDSAGVRTLQAESFSYSVAPLLAKRDVDRMSVTTDASGMISLAVRNEALETHHLDQMEVIEVRHRPGEFALPSPRGGALAVSSFAAATVRDAAGRNVSRSVALADDDVFSTDSGFLRRATEGGPIEDRLTITISRGGATDSLALVIRARSSLLTTSVLYEHLMGRQGALALDWMGRDLSRITKLAQLGTWYGKNFGMQVEVQDGSSWRPVIRLMDFGPTHWRTIGLALPPVRGTDDSVRVRLTFAADEYRVDQLALARHLRRVEQRIIPIARAIDSRGTSRPDIVTMLARADDREVVTHPGDEFTLEFDAGRAPQTTRTFFFAGQGYYVEWLRPSWIRSTTNPQPFSPSRTSMRDLLRSWRGGKDSLEALFFTRRVPVL
jgi:hypothetical protein